jgi:predicted hydrolase (HD superfamily)
LWALVGLLHDIDYEETKNKPEKHSLVGAEILEKEGFPANLVYAIKAHNEIHNLPRLSKLDKALFCADPVTGLIVAATLVLPSKKLADLTLENVLNRYREKSFAKGANRQQIATCSELGISLEEFIKISLEAMKSIASDLGL